MLLVLQVFKFSPLGSNTQRLLALGDKLVPGSGSSRFCKPTSVAVDRSGEFFVADGYVRSENAVIRGLALGLRDHPTSSSPSQVLSFTVVIELERL